MAIFEKGNAVVGQSGGPTSAINATLAGVIKGCLDNTSIGKVYGMKNGVEGLLRDDLIELDPVFCENAEEKLKLLAATPSSALGSCRKKIKDDETIEKILEVLEKHGIRYFFYIGGNDSMDAVAKLKAYSDAHPDAYAVNFIGVPKTIDNDLVMTDHTPGYGSAAKYIAVSIEEIMRDVAVYTTKAVTIVEIMGRDAGWLTAASALSTYVCGRGPSLIYLPECDFDSEKFLCDVQKKLEGSDYIVVAVSEGIRDKDGKYVAEAAMSGAVDTFGHKYLAGTGKYLENLIRDRIGCKVRSVELNILQRSAAHIASKTDIDESLLIGESAVRFATVGETGVMVVIRRKDGESYRTEINTENVLDIANKIKKMPDSFITPDHTGVTKECIDYMLPLIQGENPTRFANGLPVHFEF